MNENTTTPQTGGKLSVWTKLAYGAGDVSAAIYAQTTGFFLTAFLLDIALIQAGWVAVIVLTANLWDGFVDPILGNWSDRTRSRWGRRRPWLLFGAVPFALSFILQWTVPGFLPEGWMTAVYFLFMTMLLRTTYSVVNIPYTAMTPEIAESYDERTSLTSYRFAFSVLGGLIAALAFDALSRTRPDAAQGFMLAGAVLSVFIIISALTTFFFVQEPPIDESKQPSADESHGGLMAGMAVMTRNYPFLCVLGMYLTAWVVVEFVQANLLLYVRYWVVAEDQFRNILLMLQLTTFAFLPVWTFVSGRIGKKTAYMIGLGLFLLVLVMLFFVGPGQVGLLYAVAFVAGMCVSMALLLPWSMLPDVIDYDELQTGTRSSGIYYGMFVFVQTLGVSLALGFSSWLLGINGYVNPEVAGVFVDQPDSVLLALRLMVSFIPFGLLLLSIPLVITYPITRAKYEAIRAELATRATTAE
jgi:GPH family glycoside/pentoside/hexuronide:cation symporter